MFDLVAIGNPSLDELIIPQANYRVRVLGGSSIYATKTAKILGLKRVGLVGCINSDFSDFNQFSRRYGVQILNQKESTKPTAFKHIYNSKGERTIEFLSNAEKIYSEDIPKQAFNTKAILIAPILQEVGIELIEYIRCNTNAKIFLDPQGMIRRIDDNRRITEICDLTTAQTFTKFVDVIKTNEQEAKVITKVKRPISAAKLLIKWGTTISIITLAEKGSIIARGSKTLTIPAYKTSALDPTGAGDVYIGAFITGFLQGKPLCKCAAFASAAASIKVEHTGSDFPLNYTEAIVRMNEVLKLS